MSVSDTIGIGKCQSTGWPYPILSCLVLCYCRYIWRLFLQYLFRAVNAYLCVKHSCGQNGENWGVVRLRWHPGALGSWELRLKFRQVQRLSELVHYILWKWNSPCQVILFVLLSLSFLPSHFSFIQYLIYLFTLLMSLPVHFSCPSLLTVLLSWVLNGAI